jgi:two-component system chemotaxis sensor kinase CheA
VASGIGAACPALKVATQKLDTLIDLVGELVIAQSLVARDPALPLHPNARLFRNLAHLGRITNELQKTAMSMRMVPIRSTFQKMNRLVRDLAAKEGKQVELQVRGEDTELDRLLVENLNDPLVHMIRNAIDHGIEKPEVRLAQGKPAQGAISLSAWRQGGNMVIEVKDDGAGLNRDRIVAKALEQGLLQAKETLTDSEVFRLIFSPGFSTAEKVTEISGRGVGMDVVLRNVEAMRGNIEVQSRPGQGTSFCIHLPLTLAIINGLIVAVGEQRYILPVLSVRESFRPKAQLISTLNERGEIVNVRGRLSPLLRLYDYFNVTPRFTDPTQALVVVVGSEEENRCLLVDQLLGTQEIVIKSLGEPFKRNRALAGAAILGDGRVGLILDVDYLVKLDGQSRVQIAA